MKRAQQQLITDSLLGNDGDMYIMISEESIKSMQGLLDDLGEIEDDPIDSYDKTLDELLERENKNWNEYTQFMENYDGK